MCSQVHVVLEVFEVVTHQVGDDAVLLCQLVLQLLDTTLGGMELLLKSLDSSQLFGLHNHHIVHTVHRVIRLKRLSVKSRKPDPQFDLTVD